MENRFSSSILDAIWLGWGVLACSVLACSSDKAPPQTAANSEASSPYQSPAVAERENETTVQISDELRRVCQLPNAPREAPKFEFAQAELRATGRNVLDDVANCLTDGPLQGKAITIIGRTDPRGSAEYNKELAANRAGAARNYLVKRGVAPATVFTVSRGEIGAQGQDEATWALDRRVDFELGDLSRAGKEDGSPILEGTRIQALTPPPPSDNAAGSYADVAEGGKVQGSSGPGTSTGKGATSTSAQGSSK